MVHHRRVAFGAGSSQPHQRTASGAVSGSAGLGLVDRSTTTGSEQATHNYTTTSFGSSHVEELRRNTPTAQEGGGGRRHELPWKNRKSLLGIVALVLVAGTGVKRGVKREQIFNFLCLCVCFAVRCTSILHASLRDV